MNSALEGLSTTTLIGIAVLVIAQLTLMVSALVSLVRRPATAVRGPKWLWALIIVFGELIGPILYFALARAPEQVDVAASGSASVSQRTESVADVLYGGEPGAQPQSGPPASGDRPGDDESGSDS